MLSSMTQEWNLLMDSRLMSAVRLTVEPRHECEFGFLAYPAKISIKTGNEDMSILPGPRREP